MSRFLLLLLCLFGWVAGASPGDAPPTAEPLGQQGAERAGHGAEPPQLAAPVPDIIKGERTTRRFRLLFTDRSEGTAEALAERLEDERDAFSKVLGRDWPGVIEVRIGPGRRELEALALPGGRPPTWAIALAYPSHGIILLDAIQLASPEGPTTLRHELAHVALGRLGNGWPRWFQEGLAQHLTGERLSIAHYTALFHAVQSDRVLSFEDLTAGWPEHASDVQLAYAQSAAFVAWLSEQYGATGLGKLLDAVAAGDPFQLAFAKAFGTSLRMEEDAWRQTLPSRYGWMPWVTTGSLVLGLGAVLCVLGYVRRRRQLSLRLQQMQAEDEAEDRARALLEAELLALEERLSDHDEPASSEHPLGDLDEPASSEHPLPEGAAPPPLTRSRDGDDEELPRRGKDTLH